MTERAKSAKSGMKSDMRSEIDEMLKIKYDLNNVSFKRDVAPIIANVCVGCHNAQRKSGDFDASTYKSFMEHITVGDPNNSHLLNLVSGKEQPRMPRGGMARFDPEWLEMWSAWVKAGAKFDGPNPTAPIMQYLVDLDVQRRQLIAKLSTGDLEKMHLASSERQLEIVNPRKKANLTQTKNFLVRTTLDAADAEYASVLAEAVLEELQQKFGLPTDKPMWRGRFGVNIFADRYDYLAFAREVDRYSPESTEFGHVRIRPEHQYLAMTVEHEGYEIDALVAEQVASAFLQELGNRKLPGWAVYGFARAMAAKMDGKSTGLNNELAEAARLASNGANLWNVCREDVPWAQLAPLSASMFRYMLDVDAKKTTPFVKAFAESGDMQGALNATLRTNVDQLSGGWVGWMSKIKASPKSRAKSAR